MSKNKAIPTAEEDVAINAPGYWNRRFEQDWEDRGGREQTTFFAEISLARLPDFVSEDILHEQLSIYDFGCALGDALPVLQHRFPGSQLAGGDVASLGIQKARRFHPEFHFDILDANTHPPTTDVYFCSNTLEHFVDWQEKLSLIADCARRHVIVVVPFGEKNRISEHEVSFYYELMPLKCRGMELSYITTFDTSRLPLSRWPGRQMISIFSRSSSAPRGMAISSRLQVEEETVRFDLRGLAPSQATAALQILDMTDSREMREAAEASITEVSRERDDLRGECAQLRGESARLLGECAQLTERIGQIQQHIAQRDEENRVLQAKHIEAQDGAAKLERACDGLTKEKRRLEVQYAEMELRLRKRTDEFERLKLHAVELELKHAQTEAGRATLESECAQLIKDCTNFEKAYTERQSETALIVAEHNNHLVQAQYEYVQQVEELRRSLQSILSARTWRTMSHVIAQLQRLRGRRHLRPAMPPLRTVSVPRLNLPWATAEANIQIARKAPKLRPIPLAEDSISRPATALKSELRPVLLTVETLHRGGVEQVVVDLANGLRDMGRPVVVAASLSGGDCATALRDAGIEVVELGYDAGRFSELVEKWKPAFALTNHTYFGMQTLAEANVPAIEIVHNYYVWHRASAPNYREWTKSIACYVAVSEGVADFHAQAFDIPRAEIRVINNPINREGLLRPEPQILKRLRRKNDGSHIFVNVAQFFPAKAHALLLAAFANIHTRYPHTRLRLIGQHIDPVVTGHVSTEIKRLQLENAVEMTGFIDRRSLSLKLATSDVFVQPSVYEGFSIAMAEAAHFALPIVATRIGGAIDLVKDNDCGILIPPLIEDFLDVDPNNISSAGLFPQPKDVNALVMAMEKTVVEPGKWQARGFVAQERIDKLTPIAVAQRYLDLVEEISPSLLRKS